MKYIKTLILLALLIPQITFGAVAVGWNATSTASNLLYPNYVNGVLKVPSANEFRANFFTGGFFTATSTATSTFTGGIQTRYLNTTSTTASSTFANGINLTGGCFARNGVCITGGGSSSSASTTLLADQNTFSTTGTTTFSNNVIVGNFLEVGIPSPDRIPQDVLTVTGDKDDFISATIRNTNAGTSASADLLFNNNLTTDLTYYADCGINSSNYDVPAYGLLSQPNGFYCYNTDGPITILSATSTGFIQFGAGGYSNETMRLTATGRVGIGTTNPTAILTVTNTASDPVLYLESEATDATPTVLTNTDRLGIATSSPWTTLSVNGIGAMDSIYTTNTTATSTFKGKIDTNRLTSATLRVTGLTSCDTIDTDAYGNLLCGSDSTGAGGAVTGNGIAGMMASWSSASNLIATSTIIGERFYATSTTATSTILGNLAIGGATQDATLNVKGIGGKVVQFFTSIGTKILDIANDGVVTLLGAWNAGDATSFEIPNATSPTYGAGGIIALDTTANNLTFATSTTGHAVFASATTTLYSFSIASTSPDAINGGIIYLPDHPLAQAVTAISCFVDGGTSQVINVSNDAGTYDSNTVTCSTTRTQTAITTNSSYSAYGGIRLELGAKSGSWDYLTIRIMGYRTSN